MSRVAKSAGATIKAKLRSREPSPEDRLYYPILLTLMIGAVYNGAVNSVTYSGGFRIQDVLNPSSPWTFLVDGNLVGFLTHMLPSQNQTSNQQTSFSVSVYEFDACNFEFSLFHTSNIWLCTIPKGFPYQPLAGTKPSGSISGVCTGSTTPTSCNGYVEGAINNATVHNFAVELTSTCKPVNGTSIPSIGDYSVTWSMSCSLSTLKVVQTSISDVLNAFAFVGSFALSLLLLVLVLGVRITGGIAIAGVTLAANSQGTRLAQSFGFGFLLWNIVSSEFGTVFNILPFGFGSLMYLIFTASIVTALWERAMKEL